MLAKYESLCLHRTANQDKWTENIQKCVGSNNFHCLHHLQATEGKKAWSHGQPVWAWPAGGSRPPSCPSSIHTALQIPTEIKKKKVFCFPSWSVPWWKHWHPHAFRLATWVDYFPKQSGCGWRVEGEAAAGGRNECAGMWAIDCSFLGQPWESAEAKGAKWHLISGGMVLITMETKYLVFSRGNSNPPQVLWIGVSTEKTICRRRTAATPKQKSQSSCFHF